MHVRGLVFVTNDRCLFFKPDALGAHRLQHTQCVACGRAGSSGQPGALAVRRQRPSGQRLEPKGLRMTLRARAELTMLTTLHGLELTKRTCVMMPMTATTLHGLELTKRTCAMK